MASCAASPTTPRLRFHRLCRTSISPTLPNFDIADVDSAELRFRRRRLYRTSTSMSSASKISLFKSGAITKRSPLGRGYRSSPLTNKSGAITKRSPLGRGYRASGGALATGDQVYRNAAHQAHKGMLSSGDWRPDPSSCITSSPMKASRAVATIAK